MPEACDPSWVHVRKWFGSGALDRIGWLLDVFQS